jgi:hypothetical protein
MRKNGGNDEKYMASDKNERKTESLRCISFNPWSIYVMFNSIFYETTGDGSVCGSGSSWND